MIKGDALTNRAGIGDVPKPKNRKPANVELERTAAALAELRGRIAELAKIRPRDPIPHSYACYLRGWKATLRELSTKAEPDDTKQKNGKELAAELAELRGRIARISKIRPADPMPHCRDCYRRGCDAAIHELAELAEDTGI